MRRNDDLAGQTFGELTVSKRTGTDKNGNSVWLCRCSCGAETHTIGYALRSGRTRSCGHLSRDALAIGNRKHCASKTKLYRCWKDMRKRCANKSDHLYGGRGISVCKAWDDDFCSFRDWAVQHGYQPSLSIERHDNYLGYSPDNCSWIPRRYQSLNRRIVAKREDGRLWLHIALENGISRMAYRSRTYQLGWAPKDAATIPAKKYKARQAKTV